MSQKIQKILFIRITKKEKVSRNNLNKRPNEEILKIPLKDIKGDLNKLEKHTLFLDRKTQYCKGVSLVYKFTTTPIKNGNRIFWGQANFRFHMEKRTCKNSQENSEKEERWGQQGLPNIKTSYSLIIKGLARTQDQTNG